MRLWLLTLARGRFGILNSHTWLCDGFFFSVGLSLGCCHFLGCQAAFLAESPCVLRSGSLGISRIGSLLNVARRGVQLKLGLRLNLLLLRNDLGIGLVAPRKLHL